MRNDRKYRLNVYTKSICSVTVCNGYVTVCVTDTRECNGYSCIQVRRESDKNWPRYDENGTVLCVYMGRV